MSRPRRALLRIPHRARVPLIELVRLVPFGHSKLYCPRDYARHVADRVALQLLRRDRLISDLRELLAQSETRARLLQEELNEARLALESGPPIVAYDCIADELAARRAKAQDL